MIVKRLWRNIKRSNYAKIKIEESDWEGYFLFGIIPLYIRCVARRYYK